MGNLGQVLYNIEGIDAAEGQYLIYNNGEYLCSTLDKEVAEEIKQALEKQLIPKKPYWERVELEDSLYYCPSCNKEFINKFGDNYKYCPECGQQFEWD